MARGLPAFIFFSLLFFGACNPAVEDYFDRAGANKTKPLSDTWQAISITGAPSGRSFPSAVWTGTEMIVWGGGDGNSDLNTGGRYNPSTDSWQATSTTGAPSGRELHTAVWTGTEMIVWGESIAILSLVFSSTPGAGTIPLRILGRPLPQQELRQRGVIPLPCGQAQR